jgi:hypothetical protein
LLARLIKKPSIVGEFRHNLFDLHNHINLIRKTHLAPYLWMNGPTAEVIQKRLLA